MKPAEIAAITPGVVLVVRTDGVAAGMIRLGESLHGLPDAENHVAIAHHKNGGTWRGIEARPGGVGWVDLQKYLDNGWTISNIGQPKSNIQQDFVCKVVEQMLGTSYDWDAIAQDALNDLHIPDVWAEKWSGHTPDHVVCSSLAAWAYLRATLDRPMTTDPAHVQPADWTQFIIANGYQNPPHAVS